MDLHVLLTFPPCFLLTSNQALQCPPSLVNNHSKHRQQIAQVEVLLDALRAHGQETKIE